MSAKDAVSMDALRLSATSTNKMVMKGYNSGGLHTRGHAVRRSVLREFSRKSLENKPETEKGDHQINY